jgi:hypothetical protein
MLGKFAYHKFWLPMILLISDYRDPNFSEGHNIGTLGSRDLILVLNYHHGLDIWGPPGGAQHFVQSPKSFECAF